MDVDTSPSEPQNGLAYLVKEVKYQQWITINKQKAYLTRQQELAKVQNRLGTVQIFQGVEGQKQLVPDPKLLHEQNVLMDQRREMAAEQLGCFTALQMINTEIHLQQKRLVSLLEKLMGHPTTPDNNSKTVHPHGGCTGDNIHMSPPLESAIQSLAVCNNLLNEITHVSNNKNSNSGDNPNNYSNNSLGDNAASLSDFINEQAPHMTREALREVLTAKEHQLRRQATAYLQLADRFFDTSVLLM